MPAFLLVDDSPTIRVQLAAALKVIHDDQRLVIGEATSEKEAVQKFQEGEFDVVFLDMMLTDNKSALDVLRAILASHPTTRVVLMTGLAREHPDVVEAISIGAFGYLRKPVRATDIRGILEQISGEDGRTGRIR